MTRYFLYFPYFPYFGNNNKAFRGGAVRGCLAASGIGHQVTFLKYLIGHRNHRLPLVRRLVEDLGLS